MGDDNAMRIMLIGAHPDDCDGFGGGTAIMLADAGHTVDCVSVTDGSAGHYVMGRAELAAVRLREAKAAGEAAGVGYQVMDIRDGMLEPSLAHREALMAVIRQLVPDVVITHRTGDYHPDHRAVAQLVQDCSYMMMVPGICPDYPPLRKQPVILLARDRFKKPSPFQADLAVGIDGAMDRKTQMVCCHKSQYYDWLPWIAGNSDFMGLSEEEKFATVSERVYMTAEATAEECRELLVSLYGEETGGKVRCAEAFEVSEYGARLDDTFMGLMQSPD
ncbi:MAG: PIG-L family deacetylase [Oscillospiraceae bacterium]|nr:PIG-L family deacetylase [Oscillospiraceae bacterium]